MFIMDDSQSYFNLSRLNDGIPMNDYSRLLVRFVDQFSEIINSSDKLENMGRPSFKDSDMVKLILYAYHQDITSSVRIEDLAKYHQVYRYVSNDIQPSERTIRRFVQEKGYLFKFLLGLTLIFAQEIGITEFKHLSIDGTIKKANNNKYNVIDKKTLYKLLKHYLGSPLSDDEIEKLPYPARKFLDRKDLSLKCKIDLLNEMKTQLEMSGQNTVPVNDVEARWMLNKKEIKEPSFNIQSAVDTESKLICAVKVSKSPTDHYELPQIVEQAIDTLESEPEIISADTGYHTQVTFDFLRNKKFKGLIPDRQQTREKTGRLSENPFHKDHFKYNYDKNIFICPNKQELPFKYQYTETKDDEDKIIKIKNIYSNYNVCKECKNKKECCNGKFRQITEYMDEYALNMKKTMNSEEGSKEFKKRSSTVEAPFGTLKFNFGMNNLLTKGVQHTEDVLTIFSTAYNLKRIYNTIQDEINETNNIKLFKEKMEILLNLDLKITEIPPKFNS